MHKLPFRQIHLDFHTSGELPDIGGDFNADQWIATLKAASVNSVTLFAVCHHGWHYHPTQVGNIHPHLKFDLLRRQFDALKSAGINAPIYITGGFNQQLADRRMDFQVIHPEGKVVDPLIPCYKLLCFNTPYLDYLCDEVRETARLFPDCDGIFIDIISAPECFCPYCMASMAKLGLDAEKKADRDKHRKLVLDNYYRKILAALREVSATMPLFQNSGHVPRGERKLYGYMTHLELESLPTGGWGYDHFPMSALSAAHSGLDFLGMTGKFHTTWGEFGGFKDPNALRYECALMLALGSKCSVGDQLHPSAKLDPTTYEVIGAAYREVESREAWCENVKPVADIAVLSSDSIEHAREHDDADTGVCRLLLESHCLFDLLSFDDDFDGYRLLILPDNVKVNAELKTKLDRYLAAGGRLLLTGDSGLDADGKMIFDVGGSVAAVSEFSPDYILPEAEFLPEWCTTPFVMYTPSRRLTVTDGKSLGQVYDPYFNRTWRHFSSHQHTPNRPEPSGFASGVRKGQIAYLAHPVFTLYRRMGTVLLRKYMAKLIAALLEAPPTAAVTALPSSGRMTLAEQARDNRYVMHLLYAVMAPRGGGDDRPAGITVVEDLPVLHDVEATLRLPREVKTVTLQPAGEMLEFGRDADGAIRFTVPPFSCHAMIELAY